MFSLSGDSARVTVSRSAKLTDIVPSISDVAVAVKAQTGTLDETKERSSDNKA